MNGCDRREDQNHRDLGMKWIGGKSSTDLNIVFVDKKDMIDARVQQIGYNMIVLFQPIFVTNGDFRNFCIQI